MSLKALSEYTFFSRYSQFLPEKKRRETWSESVRRVFDMHRKKYAEQIQRNPKLAEEIDFAEKQVLKKRVLGSQRALQYGGDDTLKKNARIYNCSGLHIDRPRAFATTMWLLLCFHPDTLVKTKAGDKKISELTTEDEIQSYDIENDSFVWTNPSDVFETPSKNKEKIKLTFEDGSEISCTSDHLIYTTNRGWVEAQDLTEEDDIKFN
jgi:hypothetical protein